MRLETQFETATMGREMARAPVLAAGGIVLRQEETPLIAVVRLRKRNEWVLPKGKLDDGETPRAAAEREVVEETGHDVSVHEFLGTLVYESGGRSKVVHYWRMETTGERAHNLMDDVSAVDWLPLDAALERLSRAYERVFLANVGPLALEEALAEVARRKQASLENHRGRQLAATLSSLRIPVSGSPQPDLASSAIGQDQRPSAASDAVASVRSVPSTDVGTVPQFVEAGGGMPAAAAENSSDNDTLSRARGQRRNLVQRVRDWLRRAA